MTVRKNKKGNRDWESIGRERFFFLTFLPSYQQLNSIYFVTVASECNVYSLPHILWSSKHVSKSSGRISGCCFLELLTPALSVFCRMTERFRNPISLGVISLDFLTLNPSGMLLFLCNSYWLTLIMPSANLANSSSSFRSLMANRGPEMVHY